MNKAKSIGQVVGILALSIALAQGPISFGVAHAQFADDGGCCSYDYTYTPDSSYDYTYTPDSSYDYTYTPDTSSSYDYTYTPDSSYDYTYTPDANYDIYDTASPNYDIYDTASPNYDVYDTASLNNQYQTQYQTSQYQTSQGYQYATGGQSSYHTTPMTVVPPTYWPTTPSYPTYPVQPVQPTRPQPTPTNTTVNTNTNTCLYNICNTSYTDNSINGSFNTNTAPVYVATPQPIVQYVYPQNYQTYSQAPFCSITIGQGYQAGMTNLTWSSSGASSAYISPNVGSVNVSGTTNIYSYGNAVYTLTVSGPGGSYTCRTQSYIAPVPTTPYVSLSQIPYTGFDFGTFGNALYWMGLLAFAVAGAYLVVYYQGGALALASNMLGGRTVSYSETTTETVPAPVEVEVAHEVAHEAPAALFNLPTMSAASTKDSMTVAHTADGVPRIVITRS